MLLPLVMMHRCHNISILLLLGVASRRVSSLANDVVKLSNEESEIHHHHHHHQPQKERNELETTNLLNKIETHLTPLSDTINTKLFRTQTYEPSKIYKFQDLLAALPTVYEGIANSNFYLGETTIENGYEYGLVNLAAFLAQCIHETIKYDACDENNWDLVNNRYPIANSCGQLGQSYQDYVCPPGEEYMQCEVDPNMSITATTHATWYGAPPPLFCGPKKEFPFVGYWDYNCKYIYVELYSFVVILLFHLLCYKNLYTQYYCITP